MKNTTTMSRVCSALAFLTIGGVLGVIAGIIIAIHFINNMSVADIITKMWGMSL